MIEPNVPARVEESAQLTHRFDLARNRLRRVFDSIVAIAIIAISSPILALACLAILFEDGGPVLFKQRRAGRFERLFIIYKLRTMRRESCIDGPAPADESDPRVTKVGRILRRTSIDELPQLINVLRGEMSIVGPRPEMPLMLERYEKWQHLRHLVTPGLTCIWQISARSNIPLHRPEATALDLDYIRRASPRLDGVLLARTILSVVFPRGAY